VLEQASVIGLEFEWEALGELTSGGRRPAGPQLAALVRKDLIQRHELIGDTFRFRHILIRDAAYERVPKRVRSELHERVAAWLEPRGDEFDEIVVSSAIRVFRELGDDLALARALAFSGRLQFWIGRAQEALEDFEQAALLAREAGNRGEEAEYLHHVVSALTHGPTPEPVALLRIEELRRAEGLDPRFEVSALLSSGWLEGMQDRFEVARELVARGRELAQEFGMELTLLTEATICAGSIELLAGDGAAAEAALRPACERLEEIGEVGYLSSVSPLLADGLCVQGLDEEALAITDRWRADQLTVAEDIDAQAAWRRVRGKAFARVGELDEGERLAREAMKIAERTDHLPLRAWVMSDLAEVLRLAGRPDEAAGATREALRLCEAKGNLAAVRLLTDSSVTR